MFLKAVLAILALPCIVSGVVPTLLINADPWRMTGHWAGFIPVLLGLSLLFASIRAFYRAGKGTLAPWAPPESVVQVGPYRFVRSPMYVGILIFVTGLATAFGSPLSGGYAAFLAAVFHFNLVHVEEPRLAKTHGEAWHKYAARVPRWLPKL